MALCPGGHASSTDDWCDVCGAPIAAGTGGRAAPVADPGADPGAVPASTPVRAPDQEDTDHSPGTELLSTRSKRAGGKPCPVCGAPRRADDRYCERCGLDLDDVMVPVAGWSAAVAADRGQYERTAPDGLPFPLGRRPVTVALAGAEIAIGRRNEARGIEPAIDLSGPLADPGASHRHAVLVRLEDGDYQVTDLGSTNGTTLNEGLVTLEPGRPRRLADGDRIHLGVWTTVTVRRSQLTGAG